MTETACNPIRQLLRRVYRDARGKDLSDQELLRRFLGERDEAAFAALLGRHGPMVLDVCRSVLGNEADAEDALQATFLLLVRKAEAIRKAASLASWLHGVAYRTALKARADFARRHKHEARAPQRSPTLDSDELSWREVRQAVHEELERLPARQRAALVLCYLQGKTQDKAAAQLGLAKGTLKGHLERGRALLRTRLLRRGLGPGLVLGLGAWPAAAAMACLAPPRLALLIKAATVVAAGGALASVVSPPVAALSEGMAQTMGLPKWKIAALLLVVLAASGTVAALGMPRGGATGGEGQPTLQERPQPGADAPAQRQADPSRPIRFLRGHTERVTSVVYSADGRWIATAGWDGTVRLWDARIGQEVRRLDVPAPRDYSSAHLKHVLFSPDSALLVAAWQAAPNESGVSVWKRSSGEKLYDFPGGYGSVALSLDGRLIACGGWGRGAEVNAGVIRLFELATGKPAGQLHGHQSRIDALAFAPDGQTVFAQVGIPRPPLANGASRMGFDPAGHRAWDVATGKERRFTWNGLWSGGLLATSPDGRTLAAGTILSEIATGGQRVELTGHTNDVCAVAFSPDGRTLASGSMDGTVRLWDPPSGKEIGRLGLEVPRFAGRGWVLAIAFSPDGRRLVAGGLDKNVALWDVSHITDRPRQRIERSPADLEADWKALAGDAATGYAALSRLVSCPQRAVAFLAKQLQSREPVDTKRIARLIAELDNKRFAVREQATRELEAMADRAVPALRKALTEGPSLEARRRLEALLDRREGAAPSAETVRRLRAVEALEGIGNPEARQLLNKLAAGPAELRLTQEAKAAAERLAKAKRN
jgi:RNA polymerase sigma factor (sigma-70 family)